MNQEGGGGEVKNMNFKFNMHPTYKFPFKYFDWSGIKNM